jgi:hypothetical protein
VNIIHIGLDKDYFVENLALEQSGLGSHVKSILIKETGKNTQNYRSLLLYLQSKNEPINIIHLHTEKMLQQENFFEDVLNACSQTHPPRIVLSLYGSAKNVIKKSDPLKNNHTIQRQLQKLNALLISDSEIYEELKSHYSNCSWLEIPIKEKPGYSIQLDILKSKIRIGLDKESLTNLNQIISNLNKNSPKLETIVYNGNLFSKSHNLSEWIDSIDVLIDLNTDSCLSLLSLEALSYGRTVITNISSKAQNQIKHLQTAPVLNCSTRPIESRLQGIILEPKCLGDFSKRAQAYIHNHNSSGTIAKILLEIYAQL